MSAVLTCVLPKESRILDFYKGYPIRMVGEHRSYIRYVSDTIDIRFETSLLFEGADMTFDTMLVGNNFYFRENIDNLFSNISVIDLDTGNSTYLFPQFFASQLHGGLQMFDGKVVLCRDDKVSLYDVRTETESETVSGRYNSKFAVETSNGHYVHLLTGSEFFFPNLQVCSLDGRYVKSWNGPVLEVATGKALSDEYSIAFPG